MNWPSARPEVLNSGLKQSCDVLRDELESVRPEKMDMVLVAVGLTNCALNPRSSWLLQTSGDAGINVSLRSGMVPPVLKKDSVACLFFNRPALDPVELGNVHPVSNRRFGKCKCYQ